MKKLNKNLGLAWVKNLQRLVLYDRVIMRGKFKGKLNCYLIRGRDASGEIVRGKNIKLTLANFIERPETLKGVENEKSD